MFAERVGVVAVVGCDVPDALGAIVRLLVGRASLLESKARAAQGLIGVARTAHVHVVMCNTDQRRTAGPQNSAKEEGAAGKTKHLSSRKRQRRHVTVFLFTVSGLSHKLSFSEQRTL